MLPRLLLENTHDNSINRIRSLLKMDDSSLMLWSVLFGGIGAGYFIYGKKQKAPVPLFAGLALLVFPYFMPNVMLLLLIGLALVALPYFVKI